MNRAQRRRTEQPSAKSEAELMADAGRRLAELCADPPRARRAYESALAILAISLEAPMPLSLPAAARSLWEQRRSELRDSLALMTAGLDVAVKGGAP